MFSNLRSPVESHEKEKFTNQNENIKYYYMLWLQVKTRRLCQTRLTKTFRKRKVNWKTKTENKVGNREIFLSSIFYFLFPIFYFLFSI